MPRTLTAFSALLIVVLGAGARALERDVDDAALTHGEELSGELRRAEKDTLEAVLDRSGKDAGAALLDARALLEDARRELEASVKECADIELRAQLSLSVDRLAAKTAAFRLKASSASLRWEALDEDALASRRGDYRPKDRARDLAKADAALSKLSAGRPERPRPPAESEALAALRACSAELSAALAPLKAAAARSPRAPLGDRAERLEEDADGVAREADHLAVARTLMRIDEDAFEEKEER